MKKEELKDLILAVMYATSWKEKIFDDQTIDRTWKTYPFELINELEDDELLNNSKRAKSVTLTTDGAKKAKDVLERLAELGFLDKD